MHRLSWLHPFRCTLHRARTGARNPSVLRHVLELNEGPRVCRPASRSQTNRRMGRLEFETLTIHVRPANASDRAHLGEGSDPKRRPLGKSRVREIRPPGSVRARAEGLVAPTITRPKQHPEADQARAWIRPEGWSRQHVLVKIPKPRQALSLSSVHLGNDC